MARRQDNPEQSPRYLSVREAAAYCSLSVSTIRNLLRSGSLKGRRPVAGRVLVDRVELDRFVGGATAVPAGVRRGVRHN